MYRNTFGFVEKAFSKLNTSWWARAGILALVGFTILYLLKESQQLSVAEVKASRRIFSGKPYIIDTPACRIPNLEAKSAEAMKYMEDLEPIDCGKPPLVVSNDTHLEIIHSVLPKYGIKDPSSMSCCYRPMWRHVPNIVIDSMNASWLYDKRNYDNDIRYSKHCYPFHNPVEIYHHFVRVECGRGESMHLKEFYRDFHAFFPKPMPSRIRKSARPLINVLLLGIDSLSRLNMIRKMPLTYKYISKTLHGIPMLGYNKIALNTFPNLIPLLSGYTEGGLVNKCWHNDTAHFDLCPWIWKSFSDKGYRTAFCEDSPQMALFTYYRYGFVLQPTDYDASTMMIPAEDDISKNDNFCFGSRSQSEVLLNYTLKHIRAMHRYQENFISLSWGVRLSHNDVNDPQQADPLYLSFLQDIHDQGILDNTFLIFLSDHGLRFGDFLTSAQGKLEGNLPALFVVPPQWFQQKYPTAVQNLRRNRHRLLTTLDLHATLRDLADLAQLEERVIKTRENDVRNRQGGRISLFLPIPENRSCKDAQIPDGFCACEHLKRVDVDTPEVAKVAQFVVDEINYNIVGNHSLCIPRTLKSVQEAAKGAPLLESDKEGTVIVEYQVSVYADPGNALFSALVRHFIKNDSLKLVGEVSRLNKYGTQSACMKEYTLLPFCYCKQ